MSNHDLFSFMIFLKGSTYIASKFVVHPCVLFRNGAPLTFLVHPSVYRAHRLKSNVVDYINIAYFVIIFSQNQTFKTFNDIKRIAF